MNILINTLKESSITDTAKLVHIYLFNRWLLNNHREKIYDKAKLPTQTAIAEAIGNSHQNIKKAIEQLTQNNLLNLYEDKLYTVSVRNNDGELVELTDPTEFTEGNHCLINTLGNYISVDNETFKTKLLTAPTKIVYIIAKYVWMKPDGEQYKPISYYSEFAKKGFTFLTENDLKYAIRKLTNNGFIEKELTTFKSFKGFTKLKFHTINDLAKAIEEKTNVISASTQEISASTQEVEDIIGQLPDGFEEIKELIKDKLNTIKTQNDTIKTQNEEIKDKSKSIQSLTEDEIQDIISKCNTQINANKTLRSLPEGKYNYFITVLKGMDNLPITLRKFA